MRSDPDYVQSRHSRSFLTVLDPRDWVVDNLLYKFLHGTRATFRVVAPRVVSTT
jgi:hypothetical protein